jgi:hypothetical protein
MKGKQILLVMAISGATAVGSVAGYNHFFNKQNISAVGNAQNGMPANYAGFFDGKVNGAAEMLDLTKAANASVPAVVHIKTRVPAKKQTNNVTRNRGNNFDD